MLNAEEFTSDPLDGVEKGNFVRSRHHHRFFLTARQKSHVEQDMANWKAEWKERTAHPKWIWKGVATRISWFNAKDQAKQYGDETFGRTGQHLEKMNYRIERLEQERKP
jgi:hypothetical protein